MRRPGVSVDSPQFDPGGFYEFNINNGSVKTRSGERVLVLGQDVLGPLVSAAAASGDLTPLRALGSNLASHAKSAIAGAPADAAPADVFSAAAGVVGVFGFGRLEVERWGEAIALRMVDAPALDERRLANAALLGGLLSGLSGDEVACVPVDDRFLVVSPNAADAVWKLARGGAAVADIVAALHGGAS